MSTASWKASKAYDLTLNLEGILIDWDGYDNDEQRKAAVTQVCHELADTLRGEVSEKPLKVGTQEEVARRRCEFILDEIDQTLEVFGSAEIIQVHVFSGEHKERWIVRKVSGRRSYRNWWDRSKAVSRQSVESTIYGTLKACKSHGWDFQVKPDD